MALPTLNKTWVFTKINQAIKEQRTSYAGGQVQLYTVVDAIRSWAGWEVKGSSDSVTAGMDGVDRWTNYTKVVWGGNFSWIVLRKPNAGGAGKNFEVMIAPYPGNTLFIYVYYSWAGFTGGTINTRPTATDTYMMIDWYYWRNTGNNNNFDCVVHSVSSSDGNVGRVVMLKDNVPILYVAFETAQNPVTGWTHPFYATWLWDSKAAITLDALTDSANVLAYDANAPAGWFANYLTCETQVDATTPERIPYRNEIGAESPLYPVGAISLAANKRGRHGQLYDLWWGTSTRRVGDAYPDDATKQFLNIGGHLVVPWNGSAFTPL